MTGAVEPPARPIRSRVQHLRPQLVINASLLAVGLAVGAAVAGWAGAIGVAAGIGLVVVSYVATTLAIAWADSVNFRLVFPVGMAMYVTKFSLFGAMLIIIGGTEWAGRIPMAIGIVAGVVAWTATQIWWTLHHAHPYVATTR